MKLVKPRLPAITHDLSLEFDAQDPHPRITHDMEFDIPLSILESNRGKGSLGTRRRVSFLMSRSFEMGRSIVEGLGRALIEKPQGQPGKPDSGGYSIAQSLDWAKDDYKEFKVSYHERERR